MLQGRADMYCFGIECPIRKSCLRYSKGLVAMENDGTTDKFIRKCTRQRRFLQDENNVNQDSRRR